MLTHRQVEEIKGFLEKSQNPIFFFADVPHMLKLLRNHFLDQGFFLPSGEILTKEIFDKLLNLDSGELKLCHKINQSPLLVSGPDRQNVRKAAQLFSNTVSNFINIYMPEFEAAEKFLKLVESFLIFLILI